MKINHTILAIFVMGIWASNIVAVRIGTEEITGWTLVTLRMTLMTLILLPFVPYPRGHIKKIIGLSVTMGTFHFGLMFVALERIQAGTAALIFITSVPFALLLALIFFRERLSWRQAGGVLVSFLGVLLLLGEPRINNQSFHVVLALVSALSFGAANLQLRSLGGVNVFSINAWLTAFAVPQMALLSLLLERGQLDAITAARAETWASIAYMGIFVGILGHGLWYLLVPRYTTSQTIPFTLLIPVFGVLFGIIFRQETLTLLFAFGGLVTVSGVAIILLRSNESNKNKNFSGREV